MKPSILLAALGTAGLAAAAVPTYNKDIAPILYQNCAGCHRPGEVAPFSLLTYQETAKRAALIAGVTKSRVMPPWKAEPGYGDFRDVRRLTDEQIALIQQWASNGTPEGDAPAPAPPRFTDGWQIGQPDRAVTIPTKFSVPAGGPDVYRCFVIPLNLDKDMYLGALEFRADSRRTVHHALPVSLSTSPKAPISCSRFTTILRGTGRRSIAARVVLQRRSDSRPRPGSARHAED